MSSSIARYCVPSRTSAPSSPPSASSASARSGCRHSCARCRRGCRRLRDSHVSKKPLKNRWLADGAESWKTLKGPCFIGFLPNSPETCVHTVGCRGGVAPILYALDNRGGLGGGWCFMLERGIVALARAAIIYAGLRGTAAWAIGLRVAINMLFGGFALMGLALHARHIEA